MKKGLRRGTAAGILQPDAAKMKHQTAKDEITLSGLVGPCGDRQVFVGFAPAKLLSAVSFADVLDEETGNGYQRRFTKRHSEDFSRYIQQAGSSTVPLTLNLRPERSQHWRLVTNGDSASLHIHAGKIVFAQVDCQHRLGSMAGVDVILAFMSFIGLSLKEELEIFTVINSKAKGLNTSLLDYNWSRIYDDLRQEEPALFIALRLNSDNDSPWLRQLDLGGRNNTGMQRRASLRTMKLAIEKFLKGSNILETNTPEEAATVVRDYWRAVAATLKSEWNSPRNNLVMKGIGVYSLMLIAADLYLDVVAQGAVPSFGYFCRSLSEFATRLDWSKHGPLRGFNGEGGAGCAYRLLQQLRTEGENTQRS